VARALDAVKAEAIAVLDLADISPVAEVFLLANGSNARHVQALADETEETLRARQIRPLRREGVEQGWWIVLDYGPLVVHLFQEDARGYYDLEMLWGDAKRLRWRAPSKKAASA